MTIQDCTTYVYGTAEYWRCIHLKSVLTDYTARGGGGALFPSGAPASSPGGTPAKPAQPVKDDGTGSTFPPFLAEATKLVEQFVVEAGLDQASPLREGQLPNGKTLLDIIEQLRDLGELSAALGLSDVATNLLANKDIANSAALLKKNFYLRAQILNALRRIEEARYMLDLAEIVDRLSIGVGA